MLLGFDGFQLLARFGVAVIEGNKINDLHAPLGAACVQIGVLAAKSVTKLAPPAVQHIEHQLIYETIPHSRAAALGAGRSP